MTNKTKHKPAHYAVDFVTALPKADCIERLEQPVTLTEQGMFAPMQQETLFQTNDRFIIERSYAGAIHPIRLEASLDHDETSGGTWVHGAITYDAANQVLIEGLIVFVLFFLLTALLFLRLEARALEFSIPLILAVLVVFSIRWRTLSRATHDLTRWLRRKLYVTPEQVK